jgi:hypothetical protein
MRASRFWATSGRDHGVDPVVHLEGPSHDPHVPPKLVSPELVGEEEHGVSAALLVRRSERPAQDWADLQHVEEVPGDDPRPNPLRFGAPEEREAHGVVLGERVQGPGLLPEVADLEG